MVQASVIVMCFSYILGLLLTAVPGGNYLVLSLGILIALVSKVIKRQILRKARQSKQNGLARSKAVSPKKQLFPRPRVWLIASLVGLSASFYLDSRVPIAGTNDISNFVPPGNNSNQERLFIVRGNVTSTPRLTRASKGQFWMEAKQFDEVKNEGSQTGGAKGVSGKLYVTVPLLKATGLSPHQEIAVTGVLYKPKAGVNPGAFNFQNYLNRQGVFAGLSGRQINILSEEKKWGWWKIRESIVRAQVAALGIPSGPLLSAMVVGNKAVDVPYDVRDLFIRVGLSHVLSASGFQTSLILSVILSLTQRATRVTRFTIGSIALLIFVCLTGFDPPVVRATIMGFAALIGLLLKRPVKQLSLLLLTATLMLVFNPLWIWDLGFQLSFLSTLGLIITVPAIIKRLGWLPLGVAALIAVPLAATIWTLPLQLYLFGTIPTYCILLNIISAPLISVISLGGFISALVALILPSGGSGIAWVLNYPIHWLLNLADFFGNMQFSSFALGTITIAQMIIIYTLLVLVWLVSWWRRRWWIALGISFTLLFIPAWHSANTLFQVTMLAANGEPVIVIQDKGKVAVINSGDEGTGRFTILPFLQQQGINQVDWAVASDFQDNGSKGWLEILPRIAIKEFFDYSATSEDNILISSAIQKQLQNHPGAYKQPRVGQRLNLGSTVLELINDQLPILQIQIQDKSWLLVGNLKPTELRNLIKLGFLPRSQVLWCPPQILTELVTALKPEVVITTSADLNPKILSELGNTKMQLLFTGRDGAIQWTPSKQFEAFIQSMENKTSAL
ncbi:MAG: ComEC/Rec2 family competence protein [Calothrix sp. C42_A2020_038]|nr:ComEC/Rec2 family competence protein [Calothrix sp. C42_A2020_038]